MYVTEKEKLENLKESQKQSKILAKAFTTKGF